LRCGFPKVRMMAMSSTMAGTAVVARAAPAKAGRKAVAVCGVAPEGRRAFLSTLAGSLVAGATGNALAITAQKTQYSANPAQPRLEGVPFWDMPYFDGSTPATRVKAAATRLAQVEELAGKAYWTDARDALRQDMYTLRKDARSAADGKGNKAEVVGAYKQAIADLEAFDRACVKKDSDTAVDKARTAIASVNALAALL